MPVPEFKIDLILSEFDAAEAKNLVEEAFNLAALNPQYGEIWIIFDRDQVQNFDGIVSEAIAKGINVGWTNPCIEEWFSVYFGVMPTYANLIFCCNGFGRIFECNVQQKYVKSDLAIYEMLNYFGDERKAIRIAARKMNEPGYRAKISHLSKPMELQFTY